MIELPLALIATMFFSGWLTTLLSAILVLALILEIANDRFILGYVSVFAYMVAIAIFTELTPFSYMWHNPLQVIGFLLGYFAIGGVYSVVKYRAWLKHVAIQIAEHKLSFINTHGLNILATEEIPEAYVKNWKDYMYQMLSSEDFGRLKSGFGPGKQKDLILNWIAFWPFSAVGLLIAEPLEKLVNWIYDELVAVYRNIYTRIVSKYINVSDITNLK